MSRNTLRRNLRKLVQRVDAGALDRPRSSAGWLALALVCAWLGLAGLHGVFADAARACFFVFLLLAIVPLLRCARRETA